MILGFAVVIAFAFVTQSNAESLVQRNTGKLIDRAIEAIPPNTASLEGTTLGKGKHLDLGSATMLSTIPNRGIAYIPNRIASVKPIHYRSEEHNPNRKVLRSQRINAAADTAAAQTTSASSVVSTPSIFIDTDPSLVASRTGGRSADQLIAIVKEALAYNNGIGLNPDSLASDFKFEGPVVGPLTKSAFVTALGNVDFKAAFPDWKGQFYGFHVDPIDGNRVWYIARGEGTNKGPFPGPLEATGRQVINPPQACSMTINEQGLISRYTIGYVVDRNVGNTGGLGGLYGILYAIGRGLPFPEAQPWSPSPPYIAFQKIGQFLGGLASNSNSGKR